MPADLNKIPKPTNRDSVKMLQGAVRRLCLQPAKICRLPIGRLCIFCACEVLARDEYKSSGVSLTAHVDCITAVSDMLREKEEKRLGVQLGMKNAEVEVVHRPVILDPKDQLVNDLLKALSGLRRNASPDDPCWCDMAINNPMFTQHDESCLIARKIWAGIEQVKSL